jgi:GTPase SAR1 family protein
MYRLVVVVGQEGAGKSTIVRALLRETPRGAQIDAEDVGQVNPCPFDRAFFDLLQRNVAGLVHNFWDAGYVNVIAGSFLDNHADYLRFRRLLKREAEVSVVQLLATKRVRDQRRIERPKPSSKQWRDRVDLISPQDTTLRDATGDFRYCGIDNSDLSLAETVSRIKDALPEIYGPAG